MSDQTVLLAGGCHPDVTMDCCVVFEEAEIVKVSAISIAVAEGALKLSGTVLAPDLLAKVQDGVFASEDTPIRVVDFCTDRT